MSNPLTGPGLATWGGAPEIAAEIVLSASSSKPVTLGTLGPTPVPADGAQPTPGSEPVVAAPLTGADRAPLVAVPARPAGSRTRTVIIAATAAGVLLGFVLFGVQGRSRRSPASPVVASPVEAAVPALLATEAAKEAPTETATPPAASVDPAPAAATSSSAAAAAGDAGDVVGAAAGYKTRKLCRQAGTKCLTNADCCDQTCRQWTCRANAALAAPYDGDGK